MSDPPLPRCASEQLSAVSPNTCQRTDTCARFSSAPWCYCSALLMSATGNALTRSPRPASAVSCVLKLGDGSSRRMSRLQRHRDRPIGLDGSRQACNTDLLTGSSQAGTREPTEQAAEPAAIAAGARQCDRGPRLTFCVLSLLRSKIRGRSPARCSCASSPPPPRRTVCQPGFRDFLFERIETDLGLVTRLGEVPGLA